ncbi:MAG TPA: extracellular solute-binding protein [Mesotoga sp.]|nr:extracellular solute-binding protein [Mesotoga sp.]HOY25737.1 extracellular solute-binding protein [Mesotoga sp.]HPX21800.1 extracellular solute-binding protein [Mesotoga sp.]HQC55979.1 extracellular solute-binding protein [Mesotoga sp.]
MYRFICSLLILTVVVPLAGLTVWVSWEGEDFYREVASSFEREKGIKVELEYFPKIEEKLGVALKTGDLPDMALVKDTYSGNLGASKRALEIAADDLARFKGEYLEAYMYDGAVVALPFYADVQVAFINRTVFDKAGLPLPGELDLGELEAIVQELKKVVQYPVAFDFTSPYMMFPYISDPSPVGEGGRPFLSGRERVEAVEAVKVYFDTGVLSRLERAAMNGLFRNGKIGIMLQGSYMAEKFAAANLDFAMVPLPDLEGRKIRGVIDSKGFALFKEESYAQSIEFARYLMEKSEAFCGQYWKYPLFETVQGDPELERIIASGQYMPNGPGYQAMLFEAFEPALQAIFSGAMGVEQALNGAQGYIDSTW